MARRRTKGRERAERVQDGNGSGHAHGAGPRAFWSGTISFGLVSVPVDLFPATRGSGVRRRMLARDGTPLQRRYFCPEHGRDLGPDEIVRGHEVEEGEHVVVTDEELESLEPRKSRDIELSAFVDAASIDPLLCERAYVLAPAGASTKPYRLLAAVMEEEGRAGIATFVMRGKEHLVGIFARQGILWGVTLRYAGELRSAEDVGLPEPEEAPRKEVAGFARAIRSLRRNELDPEMLRDEATRRLQRRIEEKHERGEDLLEAPYEEEEPAPAPAAAAGEEEGDGDGADLFQVLRRRLRGEPERRGRAGGGAGGGGDAGRKAGGRRKAAARPAPNGAHRTNGHGRDGDDLGSRTKAELYERARTLDVPGRSTMSKEELIAALRGAGKR